MGFRQIGGSSPTPTPTPTAATRTFDTTETAGTANNFGLGSMTSVTSGSTNGFTAAPGTTIGTTTAALDGIIFTISNQQRQGAFHVYFDSVLKCTAIPFNANVGTFATIDLPIRVPSGTVVSVAIATTAGSAAFRVSAIGYQSSVTSTVTSIAALAAFATISQQGVACTVANTWVEVGTLAADAKGIAAIHIGNNNDTGRTGGHMIVGIGTGASSSEQILVPNIAALDSTTNTLYREQGPFRISLTSGTRLVARAKLSDGTLPDPVNVQLAIMY